MEGVEGVVVLFQVLLRAWALEGFNIAGVRAQGCWRGKEVGEQAGERGGQT